MMQGVTLQLHKITGDKDNCNILWQIFISSIGLLVKTLEHEINVQYLVIQSIKMPAKPINLWRSAVTHQGAVISGLHNQQLLWLIF